MDKSSDHPSSRPKVACAAKESLIGRERLQGQCRADAVAFLTEREASLFELARASPVKSKKGMAVQNAKRGASKDFPARAGGPDLPPFRRGQRGALRRP